MFEEAKTKFYVVLRIYSIHSRFCVLYSVNNIVTIKKKNNIIRKTRTFLYHSFEVTRVVLPKAQYDVGC